jgi:hypothetical protein
MLSAGTTMVNSLIFLTWAGAGENKRKKRIKVIVIAGNFFISKYRVLCNQG